MLKGARERAESFDPNSANISPRLRPLLRTSPSPRGPNDPPGSLSLPEAAESGHGVVTAQPERQQSLNYQSTAQTSPATRRRSAQSRKSNGREPGQAPPRGEDVGEANGLGIRQEEEPLWKKTIRYFKSVELENKGSVARDHLALGAVISGFGCDFEWQDKEADCFQNGPSSHGSEHRWRSPRSESPLHSSSASTLRWKARLSGQRHCGIWGSPSGLPFWLSAS
jgi:hypothetical protein